MQHNVVLHKSTTEIDQVHEINFGKRFFSPQFLAVGVTHYCRSAAVASAAIGRRTVNRRWHRICPRWHACKCGGHCAGGRRCPQSPSDQLSPGDCRSTTTKTHSTRSGTGGTTTGCKLAAAAAPLTNVTNLPPDHSAMLHSPSLASLVSTSHVGYASARQHHQRNTGGSIGRFGGLNPSEIWSADFRGSIHICHTHPAKTGLVFVFQTVSRVRVFNQFWLQNEQFYIFIKYYYVWPNLWRHQLLFEAAMRVKSMYMINSRLKTRKEKM